jgi:hypothetical protein
VTLRERFRWLLDQTDGDSEQALTRFYQEIPVEDADADVELRALLSNRIAAMSPAEATSFAPTVFQAIQEAISAERDHPAEGESALAALRERSDPRENPEFSKRVVGEITALVRSALTAILDDECRAWRTRRRLDRGSAG